MTAYRYTGHAAKTSGFTFASGHPERRTFWRANVVRHARGVFDEVVAHVGSYSTAKAAKAEAAKQAKLATDYFQREGECFYARRQAKARGEALAKAKADALLWGAREHAEEMLDMLRALKDGRAKALLAKVEATQEAKLVEAREKVDRQFKLAQERHVIKA